MFLGCSQRIIKQTIIIIMMLLRAAQMRMAAAGCVALHMQAHHACGSHMLARLGERQRRKPVTVLGLGVTSGIEQRFDAQAVTCTGHQVQRSLQMCINTQNISPAIEQHPNDIRVTGTCCMMQGGRAITHRPVHDAPVISEPSS
mmetsp:Transcript_14828/g.29823  ORF Transcript_14828/g.29823 Transcript_14828/m.29823 type:complete len:144 (+) Transcript_14828:73-504(+)